MPRYTDPETEKSIFSETSLDEKEIIEGLNLANKLPSKNLPMEEFYPTSGTTKFMAGMGKGFVDIGRGVGQRLGLVSPEEIAESRKIDEPLMETFPGKAGHFVGSVLPWMAVPGGVAKSVVGRVLAGATGGGVAGLIQPTVEQESPILNTATGAAIGSVLPLGLAGASKVVGAIKEPLKDITSELSRKFGIRTTLGEISKHPIVQRMESWLEEIPVIGLKKFRDKQQDEAKQAVSNFLTQYVKDPSTADWTKGGRQLATTLFNDLQTTLPKIDQQIIEPNETRTMAKAFLDRYPDIFKKFQDTKREQLLTDIVKGVESEIPARIYSPTGQMLPTNIPKNLTFDEAWYLRHGLGEMIGQARKKLASGEIDQTTFSQTKALFGAVNNDINKWISSIKKPEIRDAIVTANDAYKQYVVKADILQRAMERKNVYTADGFLSPQKFSNTLRDIIKKDKYYGTFSESEIAEMTGLSNIMHIVQRAGQFKENPPTGRRWGPLLFLGLVREAGTIASLPITILSRFLTGTDLGKRLVLSASKIEPTNPAMANIIEEIYRQVPRIGATAGVQEIQRNILPSGIGATRGVLGRKEPEKLTFSPEGSANYDKELAQSRQAINAGAPADQVKAMFKTRTGKEYPE